MKVEVNIDENCEETKVVIYAKSVEERIVRLIENLQSKESGQLNGIKDNEVYLLNQEDIETIYTEEGKVFARIGEDKYLIKKRLYELEEILNTDKFVRISNSEIVNMRKVKKINSKLTGTIILYFNNNNQTYVSRRFLKSIKQYLGI